MIGRLHPLLVAVALCVSQPAHSLELSVQSGEHGTFTRLVFGGIQDVAFETRRSDRTYTVDFSSAPIEARLERVFDFIPRSRILDVASSDSAIVISLNCDCRVRSFTANEDFLVIDVLEETLTENASEEGRLKPFQFRASRDGVDLRNSWPLAPMENDTIAPAPSGRTAAAGLDILTELSDSLSKGNLTVRQEEVALPVSTPSAIGISVNDPTVPAPTRETTCLPQSLFAFLHASSQREPEGLQGSLVEIFSPASEVAQSDVIDAAQGFIRRGFGTEAIMIIEALAEKDIEARALSSIARSIDQPFHGDPDPFSDQLACDTDAAFWHFVARGLDEDLSDDLDFSGIKRTFSNLPGELRRHLAPFLASRFIALGDEDSAQFVTSAGGDGGAPELETREDVGGTLAADRETALGGQNEEIAPAIRALRAAVESDNALPSEQRDSVEALLHTGKGKAEFNPLFQAYVRALIDVGDIVAAIDFLSREAASDFFAAREPAASILAVGNAVSAVPDDGDFLRLAERLMTSGLSADVPPDVRRDFRSRLVDIGLPTLAAPLNILPRDGSEDHAVLLALEALDRGFPAEALARVRTAESEQARSVRARSLLALGEYRRAAEELMEAGDFEAAGEAFWLAEDWAAASVYLPPSPRKEMATLLSETREASRRPDASQDLQGSTGPDASILEQAEMVLEASRRLEQHMQSLLDAPTATQ